MIGRGAISAMLAARQIFDTHNPDLLTWSKDRWAAWVQRQQEGTSQPTIGRMVVVAELSCREDLPLHIGLMQLLSVSDLQCSVILHAPPGEPTHLLRAEARREEWELLVHIRPDATMEGTLGSLPSRTPLAYFPLPASLPPKALDQALELTYGAPITSDNTSQGPFIGTVGQYAAWQRQRSSISEQSATAAITDLMTLNPSQLASSPARSPQDGPPSASRPPSPEPRLVDGHVELPRFGTGGELVIQIVQDDVDPLTIVRQSADLVDASEALRVRAPTRLLTTEPRSIRVQGGSGDGAADFSFHVPASRLKPWMVSAFLNRGGAGNPVMRAFARGVGCRIAYAEDEGEILRDIPAVWGVLRESDRIVAQAKAQGLYFFYVDHAYFNRGHGNAYRIARNAYEAGPVRRVPRDRVKELCLEISPWRRDGREVIVCPPTDHFMRAHGCPDWLDTTITALRKATDRPIIIRQKPKAGEEAVPLAQALKTAHALVTHSSNVAIEAVCLGTPVFVAGSSAAAPVGCTDIPRIETPEYPDRDAWLAHLAYNQFSADEIGNGTAWKLLLELEVQEFA